MNQIGSCEALISKITTTIDGGIRLTIDLSSDQSDLVNKLMYLKLKTDGLCIVAFLTDEVKVS